MKAFFLRHKKLHIWLICDLLALGLFYLLRTNRSLINFLARYITAQEFYEKAVKDLRKLEKERPKPEEKEDNPDGYFKRLDGYYAMLDNAAKRQDRYFKQAQTAAAALGLTISSRCRLVAPVVEEKPKENKFSKFGKAAGGK
jgi:P27 family predicted phage terminase small subunit